MITGRRVAVTGARGRLGRAILSAAERQGAVPIGWNRPEFDLDEPASAKRLLKRDRPDLVVHTAAWTHVDACAREPELARRRNGLAVGALAESCVQATTDLVYVSTNEVFDGGLFGQRGYREDDATKPINPYGASKLEGERLATQAYGWERPRSSVRPGSGLWIVRTAWLFGPPGGDFPSKILEAADRLPSGEPLPVVDDEIGAPTFASDLASAILALEERARPGLYHLAGAGHVSRYEWASRVLRRCRPDRPLRPISRSEFQRASNPPSWAVLDSGKAAAAGVRLRAWESAVDDYRDILCPEAREGRA